VCLPALDYGGSYDGHTRRSEDRLAQHGDKVERGQKEGLRRCQLSSRCQLSVELCLSVCSSCDSEASRLQGASTSFDFGFAVAKCPHYCVHHVNVRSTSSHEKSI
jgi:hypothetical protein